MAVAVPEPGLIVLFGSGETSPTGRKIFERIFHALPEKPKLALLETPAGFELNSPQVIGRVGDFFTQKLQNFSPQVELIPARKRGTPFSPDQPEIISPLYSADLIFMGPGSPTYAARQLRDSLAWYAMLARHRMGACLVLASAASIALSAWSLPVYEIYKVGEDPYWNKGLDLFGLYGLPLIFIPHWNNQDGGRSLDTSRCFMGQGRFIQLLDMLPEGMTTIGLDEKTALIVNPATCQCHVKGLGGVTILHGGHSHHSQAEAETVIIGGSDHKLLDYMKDHNCHIHVYVDGQSFSILELGPYRPFNPQEIIPREVWQEANHTISLNAYFPETLPGEVSTLIEIRQRARQEANWSLADDLRKQIEAHGWQIMDTINGPVVNKISLAPGI